MGAFVSFRWTGAARRGVHRAMNALREDLDSHGAGEALEDPSREEAIREAVEAIGGEEDRVRIPSEGAAREVLREVRHALQAPPTWADPSSAGRGRWGRSERAKKAAAVRSLRSVRDKLRAALEEAEGDG